MNQPPPFLSLRPLSNPHILIPTLISIFHASMLITFFSTTIPPTFSPCIATFRIPIYLTNPLLSYLPSSHFHLPCSYLTIPTVVFTILPTFPSSKPAAGNPTFQPHAYVPTPTPHLSLSLSLYISLLSSPFGVQTSTLSSQIEADSPWKWCRQEAHPCLCRASCQVVKVPSSFSANSNEEIAGRQPVEIRGGAGNGGALFDATKGTVCTHDAVARQRGALAAWTSFEGPRRCLSSPVPPSLSPEVEKNM